MIISYSRSNIFGVLIIQRLLYKFLPGFCHNRDCLLNTIMDTKSSLTINLSNFKNTQQDGQLYGSPDCEHFRSCAAIQYDITLYSNWARLIEENKSVFLYF